MAYKRVGVGLLGGASLYVTLWVPPTGWLRKASLKVSETLFAPILLLIQQRLLIGNISAIQWLFIQPSDITCLHAVVIQHHPYKDWLIDWWMVRLINYPFYSFKIFPRFWLAKSTPIIHHNQLLMTKFGRILRLLNWWRQNCSFLAG